MARCLVLALLCWTLTLTVNCAADVSPNVHQRSQFANARLKFERDQTGHVAFIGGSITEMNGYRPLLCQYLQKRFPETAFTFTDAGISSTCSTTGAFRLATDVLEKGPVDLFFVEFAVNDDQDAAHAARDCLRGLEGVLRQARTHNPNMEIVVTYFVNEGMLSLLQAGKQPISIAAHEQVAAHYGITTSHHAQAVAEQITAGTLTWQDYGGVHPAARGNAIAAQLIQDLLDDCWKNPLPVNAVRQPFPMPEPLDDHSYFRGGFLDVTAAKLQGDWRFEVPDWKAIGGSFRSRFENLTLLCANQSGSEMTFQFEGTGVGAYVLAGPDAGQLECSIDGSEFHTVNLFHNYSKGLHYPRTVMFNADLPPGRHTVTLRVSKEHHPHSQGTAIRILQLVGN